MFEMLPLIQYFLPGCGLTAVNVWRLPFDWWLRYVFFTRELMEKR